MKHRMGVLAALASACVGFSALRAARADDTLLSRIPPDTNTVAVIDVDKLMKSPLGVREKWKEKLKNAYAANPILVPPNASRLVLAAMIDPSTMLPAWEVSVIELNSTPSMKKIARAEGGYVDTIAEKPSVWSPINAYFLRLDSKLLGTVAPANRQFAARWVRRGATQGDDVSPFLRKAVASMAPNVCYLFAMDLKDATSTKRIRHRMETGDFESFGESTVDSEKIGPILASIKGVTLHISVNDEISGSGHLEFGRPAAALADIAKPLLLEFLAKCGASIDDFEDWKVSIKGEGVTFAGKLSVDGMRQLLSIVDPPSPLAAGDSDEETATGNEESSTAAMAAASKGYYTAIARAVENIGKQLRGASSLRQGATYVARDARRINRLPILNVDEELLKWGADVSSQLNEIAATAGVGGLQTKARAVGIQDAYVSGGSSYNYDREIRSNPNDRIARQNVKRQRLAASAEEKARLAQVATHVLQNIETSRAQIRAAMTQKYKIEF